MYDQSKINQFEYINPNGISSSVSFFRNLMEDEIPKTGLFDHDFLAVDKLLF